MAAETDTKRLHGDVQRQVAADVRADESIVAVVNGSGPTGVVVTSTRVLMYGGMGFSSWGYGDIKSVHLDKNAAELRLDVAGAAQRKAVTAVTVYPDENARQRARRATAIIEALIRENELRDRESQHMLDRGVSGESRPLVLIKAYGKPDPDPSDRQKALPFVKQLPSTIIALANADARRLATEGYYPVAMAWYDAGSQASSLMAFNVGVNEQQLVLTVTYRLEA